MKLMLLACITEQKYYYSHTFGKKIAGWFSTVVYVGSMRLLNHEYGWTYFCWLFSFYANDVHLYKKMKGFYDIYDQYYC